MATVTVSASSNTTPAKDTPHIHFDPGYLKTLPGLLKIAEAAFCLVGFICVQTIYFPAYLSAGGWYSFVSMSGFWISLILVVFYLFHVVERLQWLPWLLAETAFAAVWSAFFFIAACVSAAHAREDPGWGAAAFFGFVGMFIFGYEAFRKYKSWRGGEVAQGDKPTSNADTSTPSYPTY